MKKKALPEKYITKINSPFSGSIVPIRFYGKNRNVQSVMIELNRSLYMDEKGNKNEHFEKLRKDISDIIRNISEESSYKHNKN